MVRGSAHGACLCSETSPCRIRAACRTRRTRPACTKSQLSGTWDTRPWRLCLRGGHGGRGGPALEVARVPLARFAVVSSAQARQGLVVRVLLVVQEELVADRAGKPEHAVEIDFRFCKYTPWSHGERGETLASPLVLPRPSPCAPHRSGPAPRLPPPRARRRRSASSLLPSCVSFLSPPPVSSRAPRTLELFGANGDHGVVVEALPEPLRAGRGAGGRVRRGACLGTGGRAASRGRGSMLCNAISREGAQRASWHPSFVVDTRSFPLIPGLPPAPQLDECAARRAMPSSTGQWTRDYSVCK